MSRNAKIGLGVVLAVAVYFMFVAFTPSNLEGQQRSDQQRLGGQYVGASSEVLDAAAQGAEAGASKGVTSAYVASSFPSLFIPASGLVYLLFTNSEEVEPNFAEQAFLRDKSPDYVSTWVREYDRALTAKQKRAIYIGTGVGTALSVLLLWGPLLSM